MYERDHAQVLGQADQIKTLRGELASNDEVLVQGLKETAKAYEHAHMAEQRVLELEMR